MSELLTNNPNAMKSLSGLTPEIPCSGLGNGPLGNTAYYLTGSRTHLPFGFIGRIMPCSFNNFNDWYNTLKSRFSILNRNYKQIVENSKIYGKQVLSGNEIKLGYDIDNIKDVIDTFKNVGPGLEKDIYYKYIAEIQSALATTNALLEYAQERQEDRKGKFISTGIPNYSNPITDTVKTVLVFGGVGIALWMAVQIYKKTYFI